MKRISILGSTGSIGLNALQVVRDQKESFQVTVLAAGSNDKLLEKQAREFRPQIVALTDENRGRALAGKLKLRFVLREDGSLSRMELLDSSGYRILDDEAMAAVTKAAPFNPFPPGFKQKLLRIDGTFIYERRGVIYSR